MDERETELADAIDGVARALHRLGNADACTAMGGLEAHGKAILDAAEMIAGALSQVASAIETAADVGVRIVTD